MNCPACTSPSNEVIRTVRSPDADKRRHRCGYCAARWSTTTTIDRGSLDITSFPTGPAGNSGGCPQPPPANSAPPAANSAAYSDSDLSPEISEADQTRAQSEKGASFPELLGVFQKRWTYSYRRGYPVTAADRAQLGRFMREHGNYIDTFTGICDRYLSDRRQFVIDRSNGHTLKWLVTSGLAMYGGTPRESAEQYAARIRKEHEARKHKGRRPPQAAEMRELILNLANGKAVT